MEETRATLSQLLSEPVTIQLAQENLKVVVDAFLEHGLICHDAVASIIRFVPWQAIKQIYRRTK